MDRFFRDLASRVYRSELAEGYQKRFVKNESRLFTFLDHDGVPWNNNNAEHAIKYFAYYREVTDGQMKETGLSDYLVLLSVYETCKYRGVSFLKFLLSQEDDVEAFSQRGRKKKRHPSLGVYPQGFRRKYRNQARKGDGEEDGGRASKGGWKQAILGFLRGRPETGARLRDIADYCVGLIRGGAFVSVVSPDDRPRVDRSVWQCLDAMKKEGKVTKKPEKAYCITVRGLAWLERHPSPAPDIRNPDETAPSGETESSGRMSAKGTNAASSATT